MSAFRLLSAAVVAALFVCACPAAASTDAEGRTTHTVYSGQTLGKIAKRYRVSVDDLCRVNGLRHGARIRPGQKLLVPDEDGNVTPPPHTGNGPSRWQEFAQKPKKRGLVTLDSPGKHWRGFILGKRGRWLPHAEEAIEHMFASWRTGVRHEIDPRLVRLIVQMSDTFGGRPLRVVSGYREFSYFVESKHKIGRALDFSIPGIPNSVLKDYLRTLPSVGVGYYPNSTHVHLDVRDDTAYWVDQAAPGEPPKLAGRGAPVIAPVAPAAPADVTATAPAETPDDSESRVE